MLVAPLGAYKAATFFSCYPACLSTSRKSPMGPHYHFTAVKRNARAQFQNCRLWTSQFSEILCFQTKTYGKQWKVELCGLRTCRKFNNCYPPCLLSRNLIDHLCFLTKVLYIFSSNSCKPRGNENGKWRWIFISFDCCEHNAIKWR